MFLKKEIKDQAFNGLNFLRVIKPKFFKGFKVLYCSFLYLKKFGGQNRKKKW